MEDGADNEAWWGEEDGMEKAVNGIVMREWVVADKEGVEDLSAGWDAVLE